MNYFTSQDALKFNPEPSQEPVPVTDQFGMGEKVASLNPVGNDLELGLRRKRRRKREAVQVVMAESVQDYNGLLNINDLYNKNFTDMTTTSVTEDVTPPAVVASSTVPVGVVPHQEVDVESIEWGAPLESNSGSGNLQSSHQDWTPQNNYPQSPPPTPSQFPKRVPNYDFQAIKSTIDSHKKRLEQQQSKGSYPHFHVTYWMFYPYSQGKTMCSISLGPLGRVPIPLIFGVCLGTRKDFGSHVGDWEHMSLFFRGSQEPDVS